MESILKKLKGLLGSRNKAFISILSAIAFIVILKLWRSKAQAKAREAKLLKKSR